MLSADWNRHRLFPFTGRTCPEGHEKAGSSQPDEIRRIQPLQNPALIRYLQERGFPRTASPYDAEMYSASVASLILRWRSGMIQEVTSFAIPVPRQHIEDITLYGREAERYLFLFEGFWISSHSSLSGSLSGYTLHRLAGLRYPELHP